MKMKQKNRIRVNGSGFFVNIHPWPQGVSWYYQRQIHKARADFILGEKNEATFQR